MKTWVNALGDKNVHNGALVAIDSATGEIVAYIGSVDYYDRKDPRVDGQFDVAGLGLRQPGSAFKPIVYSSAFRAREATPGTFFVDSVTQFGADRDTSYMPTNADIKDHGPLLAADALRYSLNVPSVMMQYLVGVNETARFAQSMGIASSKYILNQDPGLSLALGSVPVNLTNMTGAYGVFAQQGALHPPTSILEIRDRNNRVIYSLKKDGPEAVTADDPGRGVPDALDPGGQHQPRVERAVGLARRAVRPERPAPSRGLQDRDHQRFPRRVRIRLRAGQPGDRGVDGQ